MTHRAFIVVAAMLLAALSTAPSAFAKGASQATISGPGLHGGGIVLKSGNGGDPTSGSPLDRLAQGSGFFPAVFNQAPDPMLRERPRATLGPKYTVTYVMPGPDNTSSTIRQDVYPYAKPYVLSYTKPGQRFWGNHTTHGGWYQALPELRSTLIAAGLPKQPTTATPGDGTGWLRWVAISITIAAGITLLTILTVLGLRRRPRPAAA